MALRDTQLPPPVPACLMTLTWAASADLDSMSYSENKENNIQTHKYINKVSDWYISHAITLHVYKHTT